MSRSQYAFLSTVEATIRHYQLLEPGNTVLVAVSGGPDSVALLHCLFSLKKTWSLQLVVAHLNHQLRGATADHEAAFVDRLASKLGIPVEIGSTDVSSFAAKHALSVQEAARTVRYAFFEEVATKHGAQKIALGHQADDNAETVLIHLLRGTGPRGLAGIPPVRDGRIIRPLIESTRTQILHYLEQGGFQCVRDHSNLDTKYLRNRIRHELLPLLKDNYNPNVVRALISLAHIIGDEEDFLNQYVSNMFDVLALQHTSERVVLPASGLTSLHPALLRRLVRQAVFSLTGNLKRLRLSHVKAVAQMAAGRCPSGRLDLPHGVRVVRDGDEVSFSLGLSDEMPGFEYEIAATGTTYIREIGLAVRLSVLDADKTDDPKKHPPTTALFDLDAVRFPLRLRNFKKGDRFRPLGMSGSQKLKAFFIDHKISRSKRRQCPLLLSGDKIIWIGGYRIDNSVKVTAATVRVLKAELLPA